jgi:hypothetical protein
MCVRCSHGKGASAAPLRPGGQAPHRQRGSNSRAVSARLKTTCLPVDRLAGAMREPAGAMSRTGSRVEQYAGVMKAAWGLCKACRLLLCRRKTACPSAKEDPNHDEDRHTMRERGPVRRGPVRIDGGVDRLRIVPGGPGGRRRSAERAADPETAGVGGAGRTTTLPAIPFAACWTKRNHCS